MKIRCKSGTGRDGRVLRLVGKSFLLGRDPDCALPLDVPLVSRHHLRLELESGQWHVRDLESSNGTTLNGQSVVDAPLAERDLIEFGPGGPVLRIIELGSGEPPPLDLEATMTVPVQKPKLVAEPEPAPLELEPELEPEPEPTPSPVASKSKPELAPVESLPVEARPIEVPPTKRPRGFPWISLVGAGVGVATAYGVWPDPFPYEEVCAPVLEGVRRLGAFWPAWVDAKMGWLVVIGLGLYGWIVGTILRRPVRRAVFLVLFAALHAFVLVKA